MNRVKKIFNLNLLRMSINPFPKCNLYESEKNKLLCCGNIENCPLKLPKRTKCLKDPCCSIGSGAISWCDIMEFKKY